MSAQTEPTVLRATLEGLKKSLERRAKFEGKQVRIWSAEHDAWWRPNGCGYTIHLTEAGIYDFEDAWKRSSHAGREKQLVYEEVKQETV